MSSSRRSGRLAVSVRGLSKSYTIAHNAPSHSTAAEALVSALKNPRRRESETFWALKDLDFDIHKGDVVGIIGRNGAGKSTLLKILSRITEPTTGEIDLYGRVGSLLEVGTGFHPELTGRENIFLNGAILGMSRRVIAKHFDEIVEFAEVEKFLDTPVKRYSSGMYVRLAFAVAAHLNPEILIVDEVLAVGDAQFQKKCLGKMQDVSQQEGRTVLFVSHNMQSVSILCSTAIFLQGGRVAYDGSVDGAIDLYLKSYANPEGAHARPDARPGSGEYRFTDVRPVKPLFGPAERKQINYRVERRNPMGMGRLYLSAHIVNDRDVVIAQFDSRLLGFWLNDADVIEGSLQFDSPWLKPGTYRVDVGVCSTNALADLYEGACSFDVSPVLPYSHSVAEDATSYGLVFGEFEWTVDTAPVLATV